MSLLDLDVPIVLGPFGGMSSVALTAAVSEAGGLGSYGLYGYDRARIADTVAQLRAATTRPFALNVWLPVGDEVTPGTVDTSAAAAAVAPLYRELGLAPPSGEPERYLVDVDEQLEAILDARPAVLSCVYGMPGRDVVDEAHARGIRIIGGATTVPEARAVAAAGADAVVASGFEAAGHRISFLGDAQRSLVGTFALVPQVVDAVDIPVIAAGGVADRRGVGAAFALGAAGVQVGTAFLRTLQSAAGAAHREALGRVAAHETVLTRAVTGRWARGVRNRLVDTVEAGGAIAPFPAQSWVVGALRAEANRRDRGDLQSLWAGQGAPLAAHDDAAAVFAELAAGVPDGS
ncbi:NAD(P)H-dependent flavin oxidoreductase [Microbacterium sp. MC2]